VKVSSSLAFKLAIHGFERNLERVVYSCRAGGG
jgi:hypothetical protein